MAQSERERLDKAARAGWLYFLAGNSQDEIAAKLGVSRQSAQRLVSTAMKESLIKFRLDHPIANCMELAREISERFDLQHCEIAPSDPNNPELISGTAALGADVLQRYLPLDHIKIIAVGSGLLPRACIEQLPSMNRSDARVVSLVGNLRPDGSATAFGVVERLAERIGASHNPMPLPARVRHVSEIRTLHELEPVTRTLAFCKKADLTFFGIAHVDETSPMARDRFITPKECKTIQSAGGVGEIVGWVYDIQGNLLDEANNDRVTSAPLESDRSKPTIGVAVGIEKAEAIVGALRGRFINSLITDEITATAILNFN